MKYEVGNMNERIFLYSSKKYLNLKKYATPFTFLRNLSACQRGDV